MAEKNSTGRRLISGCVSGVPTWTGNACRRERCAGGVRKPDCPGFRAPRSSILPSARDLGPAWPEGGAPEKPRGRRRDAHNPSLRAAVPGSAFLETTKNGTDPTAIPRRYSTAMNGMPQIRFCGLTTGQTRRAGPVGWRGRFRRFSGRVAQARAELISPAKNKQDVLCSEQYFQLLYGSLRTVPVGYT